MTQKGSHAHTQGVSGFVTHSLLRQAGILPFPGALSKTIQVPLIFYLTRSFLASFCLLAFWLSTHSCLQYPCQKGHNLLSRLTPLTPQEGELIPSIFEPLSSIKDTSKHFNIQCRILLLTTLYKSYSCGYYSYQKSQSQTSCTQEIVPSRTQPSSVKKGENMN